MEVQEKMFKFLRMLDSYDSAIIPLGSDAVLRDRSIFYIYCSETDRQVQNIYHFTKINILNMVAHISIS